MPRKAQSFSINTTTKTIVSYTNVERNEAEQEAIKMYLSQGYVLLFGEKKTVTVAQMRKELAKDKATLEAFNTAYAKKTDGKKGFKETGFAEACKIYNNWKKSNKK